MKQQLRERVSRFAQRAAPGVMAAARKVPVHDQRIRTIEARVDRQAKRIVQLEAEVQECRRLHTRLAELTDVVQELLVPATERDEERLSELLAPYADKL